MPGDAVLEIGPGRGALTEQLIRQAGRLLLIEYDHALAAAHSELYRENPAVTVVDGDILAVDLSALLAGQSGWKVIANLPYNISTQVLFRLLEVRERLSQMVLMLQKEVGDRLVAPPTAAITASPRSCSVSGSISGGSSSFPRAASIPGQRSIRR